MRNVWDQNQILGKADELAHFVYYITKSFPKSELYGLTSQLRRAAVSVPTNMIEGYFRLSTKSHIHFLEIAYASLMETHYLLDFSFKEKLITQVNFQLAIGLCEQVEKMLYSKIRTMKQE